jgi:Domain of unknown function (DUF4440)
MPNETEYQIAAAEERLRFAMLASDIGVLDELISPDLTYTSRTGQLFNKQDDLDLHRSGVLKFHTIEPSERSVKIYDRVAIVVVRMKLSGVQDGVPFAGDCRFTRIWHLAENKAWQVVAGHVGDVQEPRT